LGAAVLLTHGVVVLEAEGVIGVVVTFKPEVGILGVTGVAATGVVGGMTGGVPPIGGFEEGTELVGVGRVLSIMFGNISINSKMFPI
jgi:hypothetical protein